MPILGVCLGHQCIGQAFGGQIVRARAADARQDLAASTTTGSGVFAGLPDPLRPTRYHSLVVDRARTLPAELVVTACSEDGEIMACGTASTRWSACSSIPSRCLTEHGYRMLGRFLRGSDPSVMELPADADGLSAPRGA